MKTLREKRRNCSQRAISPSPTHVFFPNLLIKFPPYIFATPETVVDELFQIMTVQNSSFDNG